MKNERQANIAMADTEFGFANLHRIMPNACTGNCLQGRQCDCVADIPERGYAIEPYWPVRLYFWALDQPDWAGFWIAVGIVLAMAALFTSGPWL